MYRSGILISLLCAAAASAAPPETARSADKVYRLQWRDLDRLARGHRISFALPSGIKLSGDFVAAEPDELVLDVRKTSDKRAYPKGRAIVPRAEITTCRIVQKNGVAWRAAGTAIGAAIGTGVAIPVVAFQSNEGHDAVLGGVLAVAIPATLGYLAGWSADRRVIEIAIVPEVSVR